MADEPLLRQLYEDMYAAMVAKDEKELDRVHDDSFVLVHMTGIRQDKQTYIRAIRNGTLNYYSAKTEDLEITVNGDEAVLVGKSRVTAAVFGGGRHTWRLQLTFHAIKSDGVWRMTSAPEEIELRYRRECKLLSRYFLKAASAMQETFWGEELYTYIRTHDPAVSNSEISSNNYLLDYLNNSEEKDREVIDLLSAIQTRLDFAEEYREMVNDRDPRPWYEAEKWRDY